MKNTNDKLSKGLKRAAGAVLVACSYALFTTGVAFADSEAGFIMVGGGESESGGPTMSGGENDSNVLWGGSATESGGATDSGAESESGGATQSESATETGGATQSGAETEATFGGGESNLGKYVQYYGK